MKLTGPAVWVSQAKQAAKAPRQAVEIALAALFVALLALGLTLIGVISHGA